MRCTEMDWGLFTRTRRRTLEERRRGNVCRVILSESLISVVSPLAESKPLLLEWQHSSEESRRCMSPGSRRSRRHQMSVAPPSETIHFHSDKEALRRRIKKGMSSLLAPPTPRRTHGHVDTRRFLSSTSVPAHFGSWRLVSGPEASPDSPSNASHHAGERQGRGRRRVRERVLSPISPSLNSPFSRTCLLDAKVLLLAATHSRQPTKISPVHSLPLPSRRGIWLIRRNRAFFAWQHIQRQKQRDGVRHSPHGWRRYRSVRPEPRVTQVHQEGPRVGPHPLRCSTRLCIARPVDAFVCDWFHTRTETDTDPLVPSGQRRERERAFLILGATRNQGTSNATATLLRPGE